MSEFIHPKPAGKGCWRDKSVAERQGWLQDLLIDHPTFHRVFSDFIQKLNHCERSSRADAMLIVGGTGAGKTRLTMHMKRYAQARYERDDDERTICPVVLFAIPDPCTPYEICIAILEALGDPKPRGRKNKKETIDAAGRFLAECEVKLVLIDNFHDIPARRRARGIELVGARLRNLIDSSHALWVLLGTEEARKVVNSEAQLIKRVGYSATLRYFTIDDAKAAAVFKRVLIELDKWLPLAEPSCLADPKVGGLIYVATEGIFDRIVKLVDRGWFEAVEDGRESMQVADLAKAHEYVHGPQQESANPFQADFSSRLLRGDGEPFQVMRGGA